MLAVDVDGDTVKDIEPHIGFLHRGVEKLMETRMYMQSTVYAERLDYAAPLGWEDLYVSAVEKAMGIAVKERAQYARTILLEFQRIASHLLWLGTFYNDTCRPAVGFECAFREREQVIKLLEYASGNRVFYANLRLGGLRKELPQDFNGYAYWLVDYLEDNILAYPEVIEGNPTLMERTKRIARLSKADAINYGVAGRCFVHPGSKKTQGNQAHTMCMAA